MLPKVSVAIITYNQEKFIRETLESVVSQDYANLEIIVSDDYSLDGTPNIIKEYAEKYPNLFKIILANRNAGIAENLNRAFFSCTGKYIAWLGGDDLFYPNKIRLQVEAMECDEECDVCYHAVRVFSSDSNATIAITNDHDKKRRNLKSLLLDGVSLPGSAVMVRRSSCPVNGFNLNIPIANDWLFFMESMIYGYIVRIDGILGAYRIHSNNVTKGSVISDLEKTFSRIESLRPDLKHAISRAEAIAYYREGRKFFNPSDNRKARSLFKKSIKLNPLYFKPTLWYLISALNEKYFVSLLNVRRNCGEMIQLGGKSNKNDTFR